MSDDSGLEAGVRADPPVVKIDPLKIDWQARAERLAADNARLRAGVAALRTRLEDYSHVVMFDGQTASNYCRALLTGSNLPGQ